MTGLIARARVTRGEANNPGIAAIGFALGVLSIVVGLAALGFYYWLDSRQMSHYHQCPIDGGYTHC